jgi:hypothetical protein
LNLTWGNIVTNPLLASIKDSTLYLHPAAISKASKSLQDKLMEAYEEYISLCLSGPVDISSVDYQDAVAKIKRCKERVYQELYKITPTQDTIELKLSGSVISKFTVTQIIEQSTYAFQQSWGGEEGCKLNLLKNLFEGEIEINLDSKYIYKVEGLVGHDGYLYSHEDRQGNLYWAILATDKLIW